MKSEDLINGALKLIGVKTSGMSLSEEQINDGIQKLNDLMFEYEALDSIRLGYSEVTSGDDEITCPRWSMRFITYGLAIALSSDYSRPVSQAVGVEYDRSRSLVIKRLVKVGPAKYPDNLPSGAGNRNDNIWGTDEDNLEFANDQGALNETGDNILINTE